MKKLTVTFRSFTNACKWFTNTMIFRHIFDVAMPDGIADCATSLRGIPWHSPKKLKERYGKTLLAAVKPSAN